MSPEARPLLVYDGTCAFCRAWVERWKSITDPHVDYAASQDVAERVPQVPPERFRRSVVFVEADGSVTYGAEAVFTALAEAPGHRGWLDAYRTIPGFAAVTEAAYRFVAAHRNLMMGLTRLGWGAAVIPPGERFTAWVFVRLLALVYVCAFLSLGSQIVGLVGHDGLMPIDSLVDSVDGRMGASKYLIFPTLCWWNASDASLVLQCAAGAVLGLGLFVGLLPVPLLTLLWLLYLSASTAGQEFLWFQWDSLLLEVGFLAIFAAPWVRWSSPRRDPPPHRIVVTMLRWLAFRLMFSSAVVKLSSGDPTWRSLTALEYHYQTQPLPAWTAWYAHHQPAAVHRASALAMFAVEGLVPFLIVLPRRIRIAAGFAMAALMTAIGLTGNYGFFNGLTVVLFVMLADDALWPAWLRRRARADVTNSSGVQGRRWPARIVTPAMVCVFVLSLVPLMGAFRRPARWLAPIGVVYMAVETLHIVSPYGLFAVMTTKRPEIIVEGSDDGMTWIPYAFRWKPGDVRRRPEFTGPHMPRLDWQMWFAALDPQRIPPWFAMLAARLLTGSRPVVALLGPNPFPHAPPRLVRAVLYDYRFSTPAVRRATGAWWERDSIGVYLPPVRLLDGRLVPVSGT